MTDYEKEIRSVLLGRTVLADDGRITTLEPGVFHFSAGIGDGAGAVTFLGIARRAEALETDLGMPKLKSTVLKCMQGIGRGLALREAPDTPACLIRYLLTKPTVLTMEIIEETPVIIAWCGRSISGIISLHRPLKDFNDNLTFDIDKLEYVSSAGLRAFKHIYMDLRRKGGILYARNVDKAVMEVFEVTGFTRLFKFI